MTTCFLSVPDKVWEDFAEILPRYVMWQGKKRKTTMPIAVNLLIMKAIKEHNELTQSIKDEDAVTAR